jgi:hypothetical protein
MKIFLKVAAGLPGAAFILLGVGWWVAPDFAAGRLDMDVQDAAGLSSQIGDLASFFITAGSMILLGLMTNNRLWLAPAITLLGVAVSGRIIAWLAHGAALTPDFIAVEVITIAILLFTATKMPEWSSATRACP